MNTNSITITTIITITITTIIAITITVNRCTRDYWLHC
jgi:hypothetical protein